MKALKIAELERQLQNEGKLIDTSERKGERMNRSFSY